MNDAKMPRERKGEERMGRWEDRCDALWVISESRSLVCDRPMDHKGLHRGRIIQFSTSKVLGYGASVWRS
jgi:hypothetical protein